MTKQEIEDMIVEAIMIAYKQGYFKSSVNMDAYRDYEEFAARPRAKALAEKIMEGKENG